MDRLIVKNFGPLKDIDIELNRINLFIGENGSGKSVLAKIITIVLSFDKSVENDIFKKFDDYQINFITNKSIIEFSSNEKKFFELKNKKIVFDKSIIQLNDEFFKNILEVFKENGKIEKDKIEGLEKYLINIEKITSQYIPAERNLISIFNKYVTTFITADIPLPKFLLNFSSQYVRAREDIKVLDLLNIKYKFQNNQERIFYNEKDFLLLEHSSSGIQSALPLYLTVKYFAKKHSSIIIEEPEQNLFPKAQKETVEYIIEHIRDENNLFMMTHSPYILTALNNLILANDVKNQKGVKAIKGVVEEKHCVKFEDISAYTIVDGKSIDIMDKEDRLIGINLIDSISDEVNNTFDMLLSKLDS